MEAEKLNQLARSCQAQGDKEHMEAFARAIMPLIQRQVLVLAAGRLHDAEDLAQDCTIEALRSLPRWKGDAALGTWLYRVCRNTCIDRLRSWKASRARILRSAEETHYPEPSTLAGQALDRDRVLEALYALPLKWREILALAELEELPLSTIGERLGIPLGTVKSRLNRARKALARAMPKEVLNAYS